MVFTGHASGSCSSTPASSEDSGTSGTNGSSETEACDDGDAKEVATTRHLPRGEGPGLSSSAPEPACRAPTAPLAHRHAHEALGEVPETQKPVQQAQQRDGPAASANPGLGTSPRPKKDQEERLQAHLKLLQQHDDLAELHEVQTTPIFTEPVREHAVSAVSGRQSQPFTQFGLLAGDISTPETAAADPRVFYNVAAPSSVFICGSQGSGKSHSLSCLLENCLLQTAANELPRPLTGLLFHYDSFISDTGGSPCEAAWLSTHRNVSVRVLCPPSNIATMQKLYRRFPRITVEELRLSQADLNTKRMLDLMAVSHSNTMPLYLHVVNRVLRDLRTSQQRSGSTFDYTMFKQLLMAEKLSPDQKNPLQQRLETLESFMLVSEAKAFDMFTQGQQVKQVKQVQQATRANQRATDWTPRVRTNKSCVPDGEGRSPS